MVHFKKKFKGKLNILKGSSCDQKQVKLAHERKQESDIFLRLPEFMFQLCQDGGLDSDDNDLKNVQPEVG